MVSKKQRAKQKKKQQLQAAVAASTAAAVREQQRLLYPERSAPIYTPTADKSTRRRNDDDDEQQGGLYVSRDSFLTYKRATRHFLSWLSRASNVKLSSADVITTSIRRAVDVVVQKALMVPSSVVTSLRLAIKKRIEVAQFYKTNLANLADSVRNVSHWHFIELLKYCWNALRALNVEHQPNSGDGNDDDDEKHPAPTTSNRFEELEDFEVVFKDVPTRPAAAAAAAPTPAREANDEWYMDDDARVATEFMMVDMERVFNAVEKIWKQVKVGEVSVLAASAATSVAIRSMHEMITRYELDHPAIKSCDDFFTAVQLTVGTKKHASQISLFWHWFFVVKFAVGSLTSGMAGPTQIMKVREGFFGVRFNEFHAPLVAPRMAPGMVDQQEMLRFICYEVPDIYTAWVGLKNGRWKQAFHCLHTFDPCLSLLHEYFQNGRSKPVNISICFAMLLWTKIVHCTQDGEERFISRTSATTIFELQRLAERVKVAYDYHGGATDNTTISDLKFRKKIADGFCAELQSMATVGEPLYRFNPYLSGMVRLSAYYVYNAQFALEGIVHRSLRVKTFFHTYNAMLEAGGTAVPAVDELLAMLDESVVFIGSGGSRPTKKEMMNLNLSTSYMRSCNMSASQTRELVQRVMQGRVYEPLEPKVKGPTRRERFDYANTFDVYNLLTGAAAPSSSSSSSSSKSPLAAFANVSSIDELMEKVVEVMQQKELRLASIDLKHVHHSITLRMRSLVDTLGWHKQYEGYLAEFAASDQIKSALDWVLVSEVITKVDLNALDSHVLECVQRAFNEWKFDTHTLWPARINDLEWYHQEWGTKRINATAINDEEESQRISEVFSEIMDELEEAKGPLTNEQLEHVKERIRQQPDIVRQISMKQLSYDTDGNSVVDPPTDFTTILHHFCGSVVASAHMTEWLIQMGHYIEVTPSPLQPIHVAARANQLDCVRALYRASVYCVAELDEYGRNAYHHACMANSTEVSAWLSFNTSIDITLRDRLGKTGAEYAFDARTRKQLASTERQIAQSERKSRQHDSVAGTMRMAHEQAAREAHVRRSLLSKKK